jgi:ABC-2 type transport system ATP-binding protein
MMMLAGLLEPDAGTFTIDGRSFQSDGTGLRRLLGVVPQDLAIYPDLTARENLDFFAALYGVRRAERSRQVALVLEVTGLETHADALVRTFSGGMKRRLNLGVALTHQPKLLILDEPTVGVDPQSRSHLLDRVREMSRDGIAVIYASHYMEEVQAICDRVAILDHGRIVASDHLKGLLRRVRGEVELLVSSWRPEVEAQLHGLGTVDVTSPGDARIVLTGTSDNGATDLGGSLSRALEILARQRVNVCSVETRESNLERLFLELTGRTLRD